MNKSDLIKSIADSTGVKQAEATRLVDAVFDTITGALRYPGPIAPARHIHNWSRVSPSARPG
jgi:nucleoid DNA-binding protein